MLKITERKNEMYSNLVDTIGFLKGIDPDVADAMDKELARQKRNLELIASENIVSPAVMAAMGSVLTNKYAEGYPGKRYYGGCEDVDIVENIAIERACKLFGAKYANVQAHSGAQANTAVYFALLNPGDTVMGMSLAHGGHLTHGSPVNISGKYFNFVPYGLDETLRGPRGGLILTNDEELAKKINKAIFPGIQGGPLMHVIAAKAVCFGEALKPEFTEYAKQIVKNASVLADSLLEKGFNLVSGGTDNHLMLVDLQPFNITGKELEKKLDEVYITVNKNAIPNDPQSPFVTSGVRIGTPAVTTRGLKEDDMKQIAQCIYLTATDFDNSADKVRETVTEICRKYPLYE